MSLNVKGVSKRKSCSVLCHGAGVATAILAAQDFNFQRNLPPRRSGRPLE